MQKKYSSPKEQICVIYCPTCNGAVAACKESAKNIKPSAINETLPEDFSTFQPQSFNEQAAFFLKRKVGYRTSTVTEGEFLTVCECKKQTK